MMLMIVCLSNKNKLEEGFNLRTNIPLLYCKCPKEIRYHIGPAVVEIKYTIINFFIFLYWVINWNWKLVCEKRIFQFSLLYSFREKRSVRPCGDITHYVMPSCDIITPDSSSFSAIETPPTRRRATVVPATALLTVFRDKNSNCLPHIKTNPDSKRPLIKCIVKVLKRSKSEEDNNNEGSKKPREDFKEVKQVNKK